MNGLHNHSLSVSGRKTSWSSALQYLPALAFFSLMLWKSIRLNHVLSIPNMATDVSDIIVNIGSLLLVSGWIVWLPRRWRPLALLLLNILLTCILYADLVYYRYFQDFITVPVLMQAFQVSSLGDSIASLISWSDLLFFIDWIVLIPFTIWAGRRLKHIGALSRSYSFSYQGTNRVKQLIWRLTKGLGILFIGYILLFAPIKYATSTWAKGIFTGNWWNASIYNITGLYGFHGYDIYRYVTNHLFDNTELTAEEEASIQQWFDEHKHMLKGPASTFGKYKGKNVIVIQAEAFENFVIGKKINGQEITPNLNALLKDSLYFDRFFHQTGQGRTSDADFGVQASLHPLPTGSVFIRYPDHQYDALPSILSENGYSTGAYHAYESGFWNRYVMYDRLGYDFFMSKKDYVIDEPLGWSLGDNSFFRQSLERMTAQQSPFYSFMITLSSHHPYKLAQSAQTLDVSPMTDTLFGDYLEAIHYVDYAMGELIKQLKQDGLWEDTILVFYGDHDNSINDRESLEQVVGHSVSDFEVMEMRAQVPLIIHLPDGAESGTVHTVTGQLDIAPTLLHWLGIDATDKYFMGSHVQADGEHLIVLRNGSVTNGEVFYVPSADGVFENGTCYNYETGEEGELEPCRPLYEEALKRLSISDLLIENDGISQLRKQ